MTSIINRVMAGSRLDATIASVINPKKRGWAWQDRQPVDLTGRQANDLLVQWASEQQWWHQPSVPPYWHPEAQTWSAIFKLIGQKLQDREDGGYLRRKLTRDMIQGAIMHARQSRSVAPGPAPLVDAPPASLIP